MLKGELDGKGSALPETCGKRCYEFDMASLKAFITEIVESILVAQSRLKREERERLRRATCERVDRIGIIEHDRIPLDSFQGLHNMIASRYADIVQYAVSASYRKPYRDYKNGVLLRLEDDFEPAGYTGTLEDIAPGVHANFYNGEFVFDLLYQSSCRLAFFESRGRRFLELGYSDLQCLATIAFLAISKNELEPLYDALILFISSLLPFDAGEVDLAGYDDVVARCDRILGYENPLIMKRHILLTGPPGCGKSMIAKQVARNHPEYTRCCLTRVTNWIPWISLISKIVGKCSRKVLLVVDEIDELGLRREVNGESVYELLRLMDGVDNCSNLTLLATTNRLHDLDEALLRPGRFGPVLYVDMPNLGQKRAIIEYYRERYKAEINPDEIIGLVDGGFTGADIRAAIEDCLLQGVEVTTDKVTDNLREILFTKSRTRT